MWAFIYHKDKTADRVRKAPEVSGSVWTWTAVDADSKLFISWLVGQRDVASANAFMADLRARVDNHMQLTSDGLFAYPDAVEQAFGADVDFAQLVKQYSGEGGGPVRYTGAVKTVVTGKPDPRHISTSFVERMNLNLRMEIRRFTRQSSGFSKRVENHMHHIALYTTYFNFCRIHGTLRGTPAMAAGLTDTLYDIDLIVDLVEAHDSKPGPRGPYRPHKRPGRKRRRA